MRLMSPGEVLDMSLAVYQSLGWTILKLTALPSVFCLASIVFMLEYVLPAFGVTSSPTDVKAQVGEAAWTMAIGLCVGGPLFLIGLSLSSGIVVSLVSDFMLGRIPSPEGALSAGTRALKGLFVLSLFELLVGWSGVLIATVLLMFSAILPDSGAGMDLSALTGGLAVFGYMFGWIMLPLILLRHSLAPAVVCLEGVGTVRAAKRSVALMKGNTFQPSGYNTAWLLAACLAVLILLLLPGLMMTLGSFGLTGDIRIFQGVPLLSQAISRTLDYLPYYLAVWTLVPVWCAGITILYFERRVRTEGYDIETLSQDIWRTDKRSRFEL